MNDRRDPKADLRRRPTGCATGSCATGSPKWRGSPSPSASSGATAREEEYDRLCAELVAGGTFLRLNEKLRPGSYLARSNPTDVARMEDRTFICSARTRKTPARPTTGWSPPKCARTLGPPVRRLHARPHHVRGAVLDGPDRLAHRADRRRVVRLGLCGGQHEADDAHGPRGGRRSWRRTAISCPACIRSARRSRRAQKDVPWPCNDKEKWIVHFPETREIWSYGSGYGGNALLGKKCLALRIASVMARDEGWLAEHMLILGVESPPGEKNYVIGGVSVRLRQDQLRDAGSAGRVRGLEGDDDRRRHRLDQAGQGRPLLRHQSGGRLLRRGARARRTKTNPNAMKTLRANVIFTNVALTPDGDVWWEGMTDEPPAQLIDWQGKEWTPGCGRLAAHPEFALHGCGVAVPVDGSRMGRSRTACRFRRSSSAAGAPPRCRWWSRRRAGKTASTWPRRWDPKRPPRSPARSGVVRRDPMAMLAFCGYNMGDYFAHWLKIGKAVGPAAEDLPRQLVPQGREGKFIWPGFGENMRVLKWIVERCGGRAARRRDRAWRDSALRRPELDGPGAFRSARYEEIARVDDKAWGEELKSHDELFGKLAGHLPAALETRRGSMHQKLAA